MIDEINRQCHYVKVIREI